jgi:hypothetical protein
VALALAGDSDDDDDGTQSANGAGTGADGRQAVGSGAANGAGDCMPDSPPPRPVVVAAADARGSSPAGMSLRAAERACEMYAAQTGLC